MFFVFFFLIAAAITAYLFPEWSWLAVLLTAFGVVATVRLLLALTARAKKAPERKV